MVSTGDARDHDPAFGGRTTKKEKETQNLSV